MKTGAKLQSELTIEIAQSNLEKAVRAFVKRAEWVNPYSISGRQFKATIRELKKPLVELSVARKRKIL